MFSLVRPFRNTLVFLALAAVFVSAEHGHGRTRLNLARRHSNNVTVSERETRLGKRFDNARFTFFEVGTNACGGFDHDTDFIAALNTHQWDGGSHCYEPITVSYLGKSATAKITDECEECPYGAIDLSPGLFVHLVSGGEAQGEAYGSWNFGGAEQPKPAPEPKPAPPPPPPEPKTTSTTREKPTSTHTSTPPATTSASSTQERPASSSAPSSSAHSTSSKAPSSTSTSSAPTATATSLESGNLNQFSMAVLALVDLVLTGSGVTA